MVWRVIHLCGSSAWPKSHANASRPMGGMQSGQHSRKDATVSNQQKHFSGLPWGVSGSVGTSCIGSVNTTPGGSLMTKPLSPGESVRPTLVLHNKMHGTNCTVWWACCVSTRC